MNTQETLEIIFITLAVIICILTVAALIAITGRKPKRGSKN